ncbi:cytochrome P450 [Aspergillus unguis]
MKQADAMSWEQFCYTTGELYEGVFMTNKLLLGVFLMICVTQTAATAKAADELQQVIGPDRLPQFTDLVNLPYLSAFVKEVFRWRPISALPGPHVVTQDDEYNGYFIPAQSTLFANAWAIHMDKAEYQNPEAFWPERWLQRPDAPTATFGFGRRICPGRHIAADVFSIAAASLLWAFDIQTTSDLREIDTTKSSFRGVVFRAPDLPIEFRPRSAKHEEVIRRSWQRCEETLASK